jgi:hypothetical protein
MIMDADFDEADPLGDLGALVVAVGRNGKFGVDLSLNGSEGPASEQQQKEPFVVCHRIPFEKQSLLNLDATGSGRIADYHWSENPTYEELEMREPPRRAALWRSVNTGQAVVVLLAGG